MQNSGQNQGGNQSQDNVRREQKHERKGEHHKNAHDKSAMWQKIEGAVAKDKINEFKQEFANGQEVQVDPSLKKKRRRRRRKKNKVETQAQPQNQIQAKAQNFSEKVEPKKAEVSPFDYHQPVKKVEESPSFDDDEIKEEHVDEPIFSDEEVEKDEVPSIPESPAIPESAEEGPELPSETVVAEDTEEPEVPEVPEVLEVPEVPEFPEVQEVPEVPEVSEEPEEPEEPVVAEEVPEVPETPEPMEVPELESDDVPPAAEVEPINPFDFPPNTTVKPVKAFAENSQPSVHKIADKKEEHINPFDLADPTSSVDDKREAEITHSVPHIDQGVNEEVMSPDDVGESDEAKAVNFNDSTDGGAREDEDKEVDKKSEVIEVEASEIKERKIDPVFPEKIDQVEKVPESKENFWMILEHAGITKNKIIVFGGVLIALVAVALFFIFGGSDRKMTKPEVVVEDKPKVQQVKPVEDDVEERPYGIISSYIFGLEYQRQSGEIQAQPITSIGSIDGIEAGLIFGKVVNLKELRFVEYVQILEKMNNIYNVDLYAMLDLAVDRRAALDKYLKEMNNLIDQGDLALASIQGNLQEYDTQYSASQILVNSYETAFFSQVKNYYGQTAYDNLQFFMEASSQTAKLKAQYGSENILKNMFINSLTVLRPRAKDISTNTEALIKGVKVFDIRGSDINAIIPVK